MSIVLNAVWQRTLQDRRSVGIAGIAFFLAVGFACDYPWGNWVGHTHWAKVGWIPYYSGPISAFDILQNLLLFSPIGFFSTLAFDRRQPLYAALLTLPVAFAGEATQLYSHGRFPSATDLTNNVVGAALAAYLCLRYLPWANHSEKRRRAHRVSRRNPGVGPSGAGPGSGQRRSCHQ